jgi:hemerythrin-like domain-containing protein
MEEIKPIKRSKELTPLSRDHHDGLLLCWKINTGIAKKVETDRIVSYVLFFYDSYLKQHFQLEEEHLFPILESNNRYRKDAEAHHVLLGKMIDNFRDSGNAAKLSLTYFAYVLKEHIRFEERVLFNIIERQAGSEALQAIEVIINKTTKCNAEWNDQFWLKN